MSASLFAFDNSFARDMEGFFVPWQGAACPAPKMVKFNLALAKELGLDADALDTPEGASIFAGSLSPEGGSPLAMAYAGHQFGHYSPRLGDGRALLVGEVIDTHGARRDIHLKGSGKTPFSRGGDGKAVLGPVLREYLIGEFMQAAGVPTTRALAAVTTGETIYRDALVPGAVLARVASSHIRVGTFQFFAAQGDVEKLRQLADYTIARHDPDLVGEEGRYLRFFARVRDRQAALIARWMGLGFVHGVMNTDNMAISGETIDYGPCAFIDAYDPLAVFSSIDHAGRYAFSRQPNIALWNLARLAECLLPLINADDSAAVEAANTVLAPFPEIYAREWSRVMRAKIGLEHEEEGDAALLQGLMRLMSTHKPDFTLFFRALADAARGDAMPARAMLGGDSTWLEAWQSRLAREGDAGARADVMDRVNPLYIPRNHTVQSALDAATAADLAPFERLLGVISAPFAAHPGQEDLAAPPPADSPPCVTFCGT
ncbi:MAG: YdiU family protein [Proteobacteria bacterium]|nr:YdiU family protein [Pseudomonadota bacterium]